MNIEYPQYLDTNIIAYIQAMTKNDYDYDNELFLKWLIDVDVEHKNNPSGYVRSCFKKELDKGTFKKEVRPKMNQYDILAKLMPLFYEYLPRFNLYELDDETFFIEETNLYVIEHNILTIDEMNELNKKVLDYILTLKVISIKNYRKYIKKAQVLLKKVDWEEVDRLAKISEKNCNELMNEFDEYERRVAETYD